MKNYKERCARLTVDLEDTDYLLEKATREINALKKEKANVKRELTKIKKEKIIVEVVEDKQTTKKAKKNGK